MMFRVAQPWNEETRCDARAFMSGIKLHVIRASHSHPAIAKRHTCPFTHV